MQSNTGQTLEITRRMRRGRSCDGVRSMMQETTLEVGRLIQPLFVREMQVAREPIVSMPGQYRRNPDALVAHCSQLYAAGIKAVAIFPVMESTQKDALGSEALNPDSLIYRALRSVKKAVPELLLIADVALDPFTSHGHDGVLTACGGDVDNDATVSVLARMSVLLAEVGADWVAPSDMMDGRVAAIRRSLDAHGFTRTSILAYAAKFNSALYGPFREAVGSAQAAGTRLLGKQSYQLNPANRREALMDALLDETEGADSLMVKPAGFYLDIMRDLRERTLLPLAAYQVSGEYAQIQAAAQLGWLDLRRTRDESLLAIRRAGADWILTYFAGEIAAEQSAMAQDITTPAQHPLPDYEQAGGI